MHAYLLVVGQSDAQSAQRRVGRALDGVASVLPDIGATPQANVLRLDEVNGALGILAPEADYPAGLAQLHRKGDLLAFLYGSITGVTNTAEHVAEAFEARGVEALQNLDGSYTAVIVDLAQRCLWMATDLIGMRAPRLTQNGRTMEIASHDLMHVAAGHVPAEIDLDSVVASITCDWSIGGHSLVRGITRHRPWQTLSWSSATGTQTREASLIESSRRIQPHDAQAMSQQLDRIIEEILQSTRRFVSENRVVRASLTAGLDSRAVLSLLVEAKPDKLRLSTLGTDSTLDVRVARQLADLVGAQHDASVPRQPTLEAFENHNRLRVFVMDGITDARRAMSSMPRWNPKRHVQAGGEGGEIFRGFFYQYFGAQGIVPSDVERMADTLVRWRFRRLAKYEFADPDARKRTRGRIMDTLAELARMGECGYDTLDLFYLYERYAQWGAAGERATWVRRWSPYEAKPAIAAGFCLPQPIGNRCAIMPRVIKRYLPARAYWTPVNGTGLVALEGDGRLRFALRQILKLQGKLSEKLLSRVTESAPVQGTRGRWLLNDFTRDLLHGPSSLAQDLFGVAGVERLLREQETKRRHSETLARLIAAEEFRRLTLRCRPADSPAGL